MRLRGSFGKDYEEMIQLLKGNEVVKAIEESLSERIDSLKTRRIMPTLAIVRVGEKDDDIYYQRSAAKRCEGLGIACESYQFDESMTEEELINEIVNLNLDEHVHGVLILRPLPKHISDEAICSALDPKKDVDGITDTSLAAVMKNSKDGFAPCTARACIEILNYYGISPRGKRAVVIGRSLVVGKPVALMLTAMDATVTVCHTKTPEIQNIASEADILVVAAGRAKIVDRHYVKLGATVIDVGINTGSDGKLVGDVDFDDVKDNVFAITPVPGGVGTVTTTVLAMHTVEAAERSSHAFRGNL